MSMGYEAAAEVNRDIDDTLSNLGVKSDGVIEDGNHIDVYNFLRTVETHCSEVRKGLMEKNRG